MLHELLGILLIVGFVALVVAYFATVVHFGKVSE